MMGAPQIIFLLLVGFSLGGAMVLHGRERSSFDFRVSFVNAGLTLGLLHWGGFFN